MPKQPKYVDPTRPRTLFSRAYAGFSATRLGRFISAKIVWRIDPHLLRLTRGRFGIGLVLPTALLETRGRRWLATTPSATGCGRSPTASSRHTRRTGETRPR